MLKFKTGIVCILLLLAVLAASAQNSNVTKQQSRPGFKLVFEKVWLHTDRDVYAPGDTLWYKAYLVNGQDNTPANTSGNLYVELIAPDSAKIISSQLIHLDNGLGKGNFDLMDSLASGQYRLRAYTNWMRNFGDNFVFEKIITILHTPAIAASPNNKAVTKNIPKKPATAASPIATPLALPAMPTVRFFPEGGSLVEGISSIVAVKSEDVYGKGKAVSGSVLNTAGDTVSRFSCDSLGMGLFTLLPIKGQTYRASLRAPGAKASKLIFELPRALSGGPALQLKQTDTVIYAIISNNAPAPVNYLLSVKHAGKTVNTSQIQANLSSMAVKISLASLPEGISAVTLYNAQGKPQCERLVYIHHANTPGIAVVTDKKVYKANEKVTLQINAPANSALSVAVVDAGIAPEQTGDMAAYLMLQSEIKGTIEHARRYFDTTNVNRFKQLDLLMLTQGWRDFVWHRLADTTIRLSYAAENGISLPGRIRDENYNKMLPGLNISLYASEAKGTKMFSTKSDSSGRFSFNGLVLYGIQTVKLSAVNDKGEKKGAFWVDTLLPMPVRPRQIRNYPLKDDSLQVVAVKKRQEQFELAKMRDVTQLKEVKIKERNKSQAIKIEGINDNSFTPWGGPTFDQTFKITPKDYDLKTLRWFAINNFNGAHTDGLGISFPGELVKIPNSSKPVYIYRKLYPILVINGTVPSFAIDANLYYGMPIDKFKSIHLERVVDARDSLQYLLFLYLKDGYLTDNPGTLETIVQGYAQSRIFYKPLNDQDAVKFAYRNTIHWEPDIKTDATGKAAISFYNTNISSTTRIITEGISPTGTPLSSEAGYQTK